jgi:FKBP-type peptidyl-prolyl cis-trans isomerase FkpA
MPGMASSNLLKVLLAVTLLAACTGKPNTPPPAPPQPQASGVTSLQSVVLKPGTGTAIAGGQIAVMQYTGWLYDAAAKDNKGKEFDSSRTRREPFKFPLGTGSVIKGWDQGVAGMQIGESRRLIIPPDLAYGDGGAGGVIPPGATLMFDVELVGIE